MIKFDIKQIPPSSDPSGRYRRYPRRGKYDEYFRAISQLKHGFEFIANVPNKQWADSITTGIQQKVFRTKYSTQLKDDEYYATHKEPVNTTGGMWTIFVRIAERDKTTLF